MAIFIFSFFTNAQTVVVKTYDKNGKLFVPENQ
jgi:hypothetical protein